MKNLKGINAIDMFSKGYSTKGEDRGFGLYNVQKIIKRLNGSISMEIDEDTIIIEVII